MELCSFMICIIQYLLRTLRRLVSVGSQCLTVKAFDLESRRIIFFQWSFAPIIQRTFDLLTYFPLLMNRGPFLPHSTPFVVPPCYIPDFHKARFYTRRPISKAPHFIPAPRWLLSMRLLTFYVKLFPSQLPPLYLTSFPFLYKSLHLAFHYNSMFD